MFEIVFLFRFSNSFSFVSQYFANLMFVAICWIKNRKKSQAIQSSVRTSPVILLIFARNAALYFISLKADALESPLYTIRPRWCVYLDQGCTTFCYCRPHYSYLYEVRPPM